MFDTRIEIKHHYFLISCYLDHSGLTMMPNTVSYFFYVSHLSFACCDTPALSGSGKASFSWLSHVHTGTKRGCDAHCLHVQQPFSTWCCPDCFWKEATCQVEADCATTWCKNISCFGKMTLFSWLQESTGPRPIQKPTTTCSRWCNMSETVRAVSNVKQLHCFSCCFGEREDLVC